ncbi:L-aminopeptidase/D-esterase-like protein [Arthrobacter woluwensis]|uniref:P1 family peptidase n=1 Tax=Arthrobacter woluwensis TaxID=156980 RepID=UPI00278B59AB|nr:P1 family peptidase [Arthrobacter woluwensis]MDQ0709646.1 L-aminopeptidase/D-esterase-like protein [Arthrobacter woluwensis]
MGRITEVPGVRVGHAEHVGDGWLSGVTVVLPPPGTVGSVDVRGGGPGTHETDALDPSTLVPTVDAVVLTGGSAYGLASAGGAQLWCEEQGLGFPVQGGVVPIVPAAAIFDLGRGGDFRARPDLEMGYRAARDGGSREPGHDVERGNVGAGTGALIAQGAYKGGLGTSAVHLDGGIVVGALAIVNALGSPIGLEPAAAQRGNPVSARTSEERASARRIPPDSQAAVPESVPGAGSLNTTLAVVVTNAALDAAQCRRTATAAHAGLARALNPSHTLADGDTVFALSTGGSAGWTGLDPAARTAFLIGLQSAAAEAVRLAILDGVAQAEAITTPAGTFPAFGDGGA